MSKKCISCGTSPQPYYKDAKNSVTQDHAAIFRDTQFAAGIQIKEEFVVPAIGEDIQVGVKNLTNLVIGSYLWNPAYGYLQIAHWDSCTGKIGVLNEDISGAAIPGTVVSAGSLFAITARPCCADQDNFSLFPFLAEDYVIPGVGNSVVLAVTSTFGLIEGTLVRIGSNVYLLDQINSSLEIVVTNQGAGGTPGTTVAARDVNGDLQYLITSAVTSVCTSVIGSSSVKLTGCDGVNESILEGDFAGQVPVLQNSTTDVVEFKLLDTSVRTCTELTAPVNVLSATPNYTIDVADESVFSIGNIIQLDGGALRWEITDNTTPNELDITCTTGTPGSNFTIPLGAWVCLQLCCESTQEAIDVLESDVATLETDTSLLLVSNQYGWVSFGVSPSGTYISASSFSLPGDFTGLLKVGQKLRFLNGGIKYANVESFSFGAGVTTINIIVNLDYVLVAGAITSIVYSLGNPQDFPAYFEWDCNPAGFASLTDEVAHYWIDGDMFNAAGLIIGTSDSTSFAIDIPVNPEVAVISNLAGQLYQIQNSGSPITTIGMAISTGANTATFYKDQTLAGWAGTATTKGASFRLSFILEQ